MLDREKSHPRIFRRLAFFLV